MVVALLGDRADVGFDIRSNWRGSVAPLPHSGQRSSALGSPPLASTASRRWSRPAYPSRISLERSDDTLLLRWQAQPGASQLHRTTVILGYRASWQLLPVLVRAMEGSGNSIPHGPRAGASFAPCVTLSAVPPGVRLTKSAGHFRLLWDSSPDATGYVVYVGRTASAGLLLYPPALPVTLASTELKGWLLERSQRYHHRRDQFRGRGADGGAGERHFSGRRDGGDAVTCDFGERQGISRRRRGCGDFAFELHNPAAPPFIATADAGGHFRIASVPLGIYQVGYQWNGQAVMLPWIR